MNAGFEKEPSSMSELAVGTIALAAVALITFFGIRTSLPGASLPAASRSSEITASVVAAAPGPAAAPVPPRVPAPEPEPVEPARPPVATDNAGGASPAVRRSFRPPPEPDRPVAAAPPSLDRAIEYSPAPLTTTNPLGTDSAAAARAEVPTRSRPYDAMPAQPPSQLPSQPTPSQPIVILAAPTETERDLGNRFDVISIQTKLRELGYHPGESDGLWGPGARRALRDFKIMNGLAENEQWDRETEDRLWSGRGVPAGSTFIGIWARDAAECRNRTGEDERIKIDARGAESAGTKCDFRSVNQEGAGRWQVRALCSADRDVWTANISLKLTGSNLRWSSERGTETYLRCGRPASMISSR